LVGIWRNDVVCVCVCGKEVRKRQDDDAFLSFPFLSSSLSLSVCNCL
jgi:hypothetical protein